MDPADLARENDALNEQVKLLVKTERRLYDAQHIIEQQLRRLEALTNLAIHAERATDPDVIVELALSTLLDVLDVDQALALVPTTPSGTRLAAMVTQPGHEPADRSWRAASFELPLVPGPTLLDARLDVRSRRLSALLDTVDQYFAPADGGRIVPVLKLVIPLLGKSGRQLAVLVLRKLERKVSIHEPRVSQADLPFIELLATRVQTFVENMLLYRELEQVAAGLEEKVAARTADLARTNQALALSLRRVGETQAQLVEAEKSAAMLTLVAGLSHELNNPIGVILGNAQGLLLDDSAPKTHQRLLAIERQARRCSVLVKALLGFAQQRPFVLDTVSPSILLSRVLADAERDAAARGVHIVVDAGDEDLPSLVVSAENLREALGHLVRNAVEATPVGGTVYLRAHAEQRDGIDGIELSVRDSGPGIPHAFLTRIFDPFFTTKPPGQGVGLGLSLARRAIETHEGRIDVTSELGRGSRFRVWLPVAREEVHSNAQQGIAGGTP